MSRTVETLLTALVLAVAVVAVCGLVVAVGR